MRSGGRLMTEIVSFVLVGVVVYGYAIGKEAG
jgi:hypothetical protein